MPMMIRVDRQKLEVEENATLTTVLAKNNLTVPDLKYQLANGQVIHTDLVELVAQKLVKRVTEIKIQDRLMINLNSGLARQHRFAALRLIKADYQQFGNKNNPNLASDFQKQLNSFLVHDLMIDTTKKGSGLHLMGQAAELDANPCIGCNKCVEACARMGINYLSLSEEGTKHATSSQDPRIDCIYCGQCTANCPVKAVREQSQVTEIEQILADKDLITIVQMAPSVRVSIGEEFGAEIGTNLEKQLFTAFRTLGFQHIFDVNMGADITTMVEAEELLERLKNKGTLPMFSSCCPAWVKFVEFYYPEMIPHLTEARSPQIHAGIAYKTWWAEKNQVDPKKIRVISVMPCTSKQYEAHLEELKIDGWQPVDCTLTTREIAYLIKKNKIDLLQLPDGELDEIGEYSGAAAIYGASGGVTESALRTVSYMLESKDVSERLEFKQVRGMAGIKEAKIVITGRVLKVAVATLAVNMHKLIKKVKEDPLAYDYIEFMACPGGCIGGGGQPLPANDEKTAKRIEGLYDIDSKKKLHFAHHNQVVAQFLDYVKQQSPTRQQQLLYRKFEPKKKGE